MLHHIIVKFNDFVVDKTRIADDVLRLFSTMKGKNGIRDVQVKLNCVPRPNRHDMMIIIDMDRESLDYYDKSPQHKRWKEDYGGFIENKAILDTDNGVSM